MRRPDLFVVGAPRCATSSLYRYLASHPQVFMSTPKEPQFFAADTVVGAGMRYPDDMDLYLHLFSDARGAVRIGEASTVYLESPLAPERIKRFQPEARIIVMLRNPVDMLHSVHEMRLRQGVEPKTAFEEALDDERRRPGYGVIGDQSAVHYRDRARFGAMLPRWFDAFGRERVHVIVTEDLITDPDGSLRRMLEAIGLDPSHAGSLGRHNESRAVRGAFMARLLARAPRRNVAQAPIDRLTIPTLRFLRGANQVRRRRSPMAQATRLELQDDFREDVAVLSTLLGRDLAALWWTPRAPTGHG